MSPVAGDRWRLLWPRPQVCEPLAGVRLELPAEPAILLDLAAGALAGATARRTTELAAARVASALQQAGLRPRQPRLASAGRSPAPALRLRIARATGSGQRADGIEGYRLEVSADRVELVAGGVPGLLHGAQTLAQWIGLCGAADREAVDSGRATLHGLRLADWPDFAHRGVMLDISRDKVPTMTTLLALVDQLAQWKINQLQLYVEHTFAYAGHERVWQHASPLTPAEARALAAHCAERCVELVPNQNSFGHLHRWLAHEPYRALAECPEGIEHPFSEEREPYSLCPIDPGSLALLADLYDQLLPCFDSGLFNVGLDETFDLGRGRSRAACEARGRHEVYLEFLCAVHRLVSARGRRMQFWGDIVVERPDLIDRLPADVVALEWGYEADHPFAEHLAHFARSGREFYVCPGTSSWNSLVGRADNALGNLAAAARCGREQGASGYLITDWGDFGHLQPLAASSLGLLAGAGHAWNVDSAADGSLPWCDLLDHHAFGDRAGVVGQVALDLGNAYRHASTQPRNGSALFFLLIDATAEIDFVRRKLRGLTAGSLARALEAIGEARVRLDHARPGAPEGELLVDELRWAADLLAFSCRLGLARLADGPHGADGAPRALAGLPPPLRLALGAALGPLIEGHRRLWLARNRDGGRADSVRRLERLLSRLRSVGDRPPPPGR